MIIQCPTCNKALNVPSALSGKQVTCTCGELVPVPNEKISEEEINNFEKLTPLFSTLPETTKNEITAATPKQAFSDESTQIPLSKEADLAFGHLEESKPGQSEPCGLELSPPPVESEIQTTTTEESNMAEAVNLAIRYKESNSLIEDVNAKNFELNDQQIDGYLEALQKESQTLDEKQVTNVNFLKQTQSEPPSLASLEVGEITSQPSPAKAAPQPAISDEPQVNKKRKTHLTIKADLEAFEPTKWERGRIALYSSLVIIPALIVSAYVFYVSHQTKAQNQMADAKKWVDDLIQSETPTLPPTKVQAISVVTPELKQPLSPAKEDIIFSSFSKPASVALKPWDYFFRGNPAEAQKRFLAAYKKQKTLIANYAVVNEITVFQKKKSNPRIIAALKSIRPVFEQRRALAAALIYSSAKERAVGLAKAETLAREKPRDPLVRYYIAEGHRLGKSNGLAVDSYRRAINQRPDFYFAHLELLNMLFQLGEAEVIADVKEALRFHGDQPAILAISGDILQARGFTENAVRAYKELRRISPENSKSYEALGKIYAANEPTLAEETYLAGIRVIKNPEQKAKLAYSLAQFYSSKKDYTRAIAQMNQIIAKQKSAKAYNALGVILYNAGHHRSALENLNRALSMTNYTAEIFLNKGLVYLKLKQQAQAKQMFEKSLQNRSTSAAYYYLARLNASEGKMNVARALVEKALALNPKYLEANSLKQELN